MKEQCQFTKTLQEEELGKCCHTHTQKKLNCVPKNAVAFAVAWPKRKTWWEKMCFSETYLREESESRKFKSARKVEAIIPFMDQI